MEVSHVDAYRSHHQDYFASSFDGTIWPAILVFGAMAALAMVAWVTT